MTYDTNIHDYVLRTCTAELRSYNDFQWPSSGPVEAPDWDPKPECGGGLHGLLYGEGNGSLLNFSTISRWLIVEIEKGSSISIDDDKVKFPKGNVVAVGDQKTITDIMREIYPHAAVVGATLTGGDGAVMTGGDGAVFIFRAKNKTLVAKVGENGIEAGKKYAVLNGKIVEVQNG